MSKDGSADHLRRLVDTNRTIAAAAQTQAGGASRSTTRIGYVKQDHGLKCCWLQVATGNALHAVLFAADYSLRWLLRAIERLGIKPDSVRLARRFVRHPMCIARFPRSDALLLPIGSLILQQYDRVRKIEFRRRGQIDLIVVLSRVLN